MIRRLAGSARAVELLGRDAVPERQFTTTLSVFRTGPEARSRLALLVRGQQKRTLPSLDDLLRTWIARARAEGSAIPYDDLVGYRFSDQYRRVLTEAVAKHNSDVTSKAGANFWRLHTPDADYAKRSVASYVADLARLDRVLTALKPKRFRVEQAHRIQRIYQRLLLDFLEDADDPCGLKEKPWMRLVQFQMELAARRVLHRWDGFVILPRVRPQRRTG